MNETYCQIMILDQALANAREHVARCRRRLQEANTDYSEAVAAVDRLEKSLSAHRRSQGLHREGA